MKLKKTYKVMQNGIVFLMLCGCVLTENGAETKDNYLGESKLTLSPSVDIDPGFVEIQGHKCIADFQTFAYFPEEFQAAISETPPSSWQLAAALPEIPSMDNGKAVQHSEKVKFTRLKNGEVEIWVDRDYFPIENEDKREFLIFTPENNEWKLVPGYIGESNIFVENIYEDKNGSLWGLNSWDSYSIDVSMGQIPILSKFNEDTGSFDFYHGGPVYLESRDLNYVSQIDVVIDSRGVFWIYVQHIGLFSFDPIKEVTVKHIDSPNLSIWDSTLSSERSIYYRGTVREEQSIPPGLNGADIFELDLNTGKINPVIAPEIAFPPLQNPENRWPVYAGILSDSEGRLWLGAVGMRDVDGSWTLLHPNIDGYLESFTDFPAYDQNPYLNGAQIHFESSNGYIWYTRHGDGPGNAGTAWYDPKTGLGCWFIDRNASIVEDANSKIWLVVKEKLYVLDSKSIR